MKKLSTFLLICFGFLIISAQEKEKSPYYIDNDSITMTVIMKHQQTNPVDSIQGKVMKQGFYKKLKSSHSKIVSWNVVMGIGQIITLKFKPQYLREINQVFESGAWGGFNTEFYPTYDFLPVYPKMLEKEKNINSKK
ncbi:hypothetical protein JI747_012225 [Chryseobacterium sp. RG1]|uniref:DUF4359 domain-containing protein n=1 Tax=Chryseobacterium tagetis TaxID=2801334 RepID=A0ABS8A3G9_9FLAO|nr:hypothetical protein [Chryseobacterium tagetis]MCA6067952.1 hypothetical protein [Chryseobacterium tagetis]